MQNENGTIAFRFGKGHIQFGKVATAADEHPEKTVKKESSHFAYKAILYPLPKGTETAEEIAEENSLTFDWALTALCADSGGVSIPVIHAVRNRGVPDVEQFRVSDSSKPKICFLVVLGVELVFVRRWEWIARLHGQVV